MTVSRRTLFCALLSTAALPTLSACGSVGVSQVATDIDEIAQGVEAILPLIRGVVGVSSSVYDKIVAVVAEIRSLASSTTADNGTTVLSTIGAAVKRIAGLLTGAVGVPDWVKTVLTAAITLAGGSFLAGMSASGSAMTQAQAHSILRAAAAR